MNNPVQLTNEPSSEPGFGSRAARKSVLSAMSVVAALVVCSPLAYGKTIRVPSGSILTIQDGVAAAAPGDTILVLPGTYQGNVGVAKAGLTLVAAGKPGSVNVDPSITPGHSLVHGIDIYADNVTIRGFHVFGFEEGIGCSGTGIRITDNILEDNEGGIILRFSSEARIDHNTVRTSGIGIRVFHSSGVQIDHNTVENVSGTSSRTEIAVESSSNTEVAHNLLTGGASLAIGSSSLGHIAHNLVQGGEIFVGPGRDAGDFCGNTFEHNSATSLFSTENATAPCNFYKDNEADTALPTLEFWDVK